MSKKVPRPITIVCGGQFGSESKGAVSAALCERLNVDYAVRTGGVNAGHTVYYQGQQFKMQQLPTGWVGQRTQLVIGPGAYVNPYILHDEMEMVNKALNGEPGPWLHQTKDRLYIDPRAGIHEPQHTKRSEGSDRHHKIGATGKGCSEAVIDRIRLRGQSGAHLWGDGRWAKELMRRPPWYDWKVRDTEELLNQAYDNGHKILLEGTQGQGLDLLLGPWPYTTHKPCGPGQWLVENGLSPNLKTEIVMVCRTYPIRVAGNSGPMPGEITWDKLAIEINTHLEGLNKSPWIKDEALYTWHKTCKMVAEDWCRASIGHNQLLPRYLDTGLPNYDFPAWSIRDRETWAEGLSEFHAEVFKLLGEQTKEELGKLFEFTTVTKKLRRVARWDKDFMKTMVRQVRPDYVVLTFLNYEFPELWGETKLHDRARAWVERRQQEMGVEIRYVSTGPESHHIIEVGQ